MADKTKPVSMTPNQALLKMTVGIVITWLIVGVLLFAGAGRFNWGLGWLFFAVWGLLKLVFIFLLRWRDPALMVERASRHENTQRYDRLIVPLYFLMAFSAILIAGLDGGRFHWSGEMPVVIILMAYIIYLLGNGLASWAAGANPFFSSESRLQTERDQQVIHQGPYRFVRHPAYLATVLLWPVTGPLLGSWWAVIPGLLAALMMFIRTVYEDRMLRSQLPGYAAYASQVRYQLFPGIW